MVKDESHIVRFSLPSFHARMMTVVRLDTIGLAGFSHSFGALEGKHANLTKVFDTFGASPRSSALNKGLFLLAQAFPILLRVPTPRKKLTQELTIAMEEIANVLLDKTRKEMDIGVTGGKGDRSVIGLLST